MNTSQKSVDNSKKSILARGCDPHQSIQASRAIPSLIGNPEYVPSTSDEDFFKKLKERKWSVVFFAPGACRFSAAKQVIPGSNYETKNWTLAEYKKLIKELQGEDIQIVETLDERATVALLSKALEKAKETH